MQTKGFIYHLVPPQVWEKALLEERYLPASLKTEGFIHLSTEDQLLESARLHLGQFEELVVLRLVVKRIKDDLKWEESRGGELFPHLYGPLPWEAIENTIFLERQPDGTFKFED